MKMQAAVPVRWFIRRDMNRVLEIEGQSFDHHWSEEDFLACLRQRNCIGMVAEAEDRVLGFMLYELHKTRLHVLNFAVAPEARRSGVGTAMIQKLVNKLSQQRRQEIVLEVRETNMAAQLFYRARGFRAVSVLRGHYVESGEDAYLMVYRLGGEPDIPPGLPVNRISGY